MLIFVFCFSAMSAWAQQSKTLSVNNFNNIQVSSGIDLYLSQGNTESVKIIAPEELLNQVVVEKSGTQLTLKFKDNFSWRRFIKGQTIKVYVNFKTLNALSASGGSDVYSQATIKANHFDISSSGGSDLKLTLITQDLKIESSGGSDIYLKGSARNMEISSSGGSDIHALDFMAENARVNSSGGSDVNVYVTRALEAHASGGSDISFKGNAALKNNSSKSGEVKRIK